MGQKQTNKMTKSTKTLNINSYPIAESPSSPSFKLAGIFMRPIGGCKLIENITKWLMGCI